MIPIKTKAPKTEKATIYARNEQHANSIMERLCRQKRKFIVVINPEIFERDN